MKKWGLGLLCTGLICGSGCTQFFAGKNHASPEPCRVYTARADVRGAMRKVDRSFDTALAQLVGDETPAGRAGRHAFMKRFSCWKFSGIGNLQTIEESSVRLSEEPPLFENCWHGRFARGEHGLLPGIFGSPQDLLTAQFPLPGQETLLCGAAVVRFRHFSEAVQKNLPEELTPVELSSLAALLAKVPETRIFFELRSHTPKQNGTGRKSRTQLCWEFSTAAPAPELFSALSRWAVESGSGIVDDQKILFGTGPRSWLLDCMADGRLRLRDGHSLPPARNVQNELVRGLYRMPRCASLLLYCAPDALAQWENLFFRSMRFGRLPFTAELLNGGGVFSLCAGPDELKLTSRTALDLYGGRIFREALLPVIVSELLMGQEILREAYFLQQQENREKCRAALRNYFPLLKQYAREHSGCFPEKNGAAGLRELFSAQTGAALFCCPCGAAAKSLPEMTDANAPYLYFGGFKDSGNPDFPLLTDRPERHQDCFNVLLTDGRVITVELENSADIRRMVSALQSRFRYPEKDLALLLKKAQELETLSPSAPRPYPPEDDEEEED